MRGASSDARYLSVRVQVGWGDCDPAGIVFYPRFYAWMDNVSHVLAREMGIPRESMIPPGVELLGFPVVGTQAQYVAPARMDDILEVRTWARFVEPPTAAEAEVDVDVAVAASGERSDGLQRS